VDYLKRQPRFEHTGFIAEYASIRKPPGSFDRCFERFADLSAYTELLDEKASKAPLEHPLRILAVDDLASNLEILKLFIGRFVPDATVDTALGGYEAIGMYKTARYDLLLLDLKMPGLNGYDLLEKLRDIAEPARVYALTGDIYDETYQRVSETGFDGLLEKPIRPDRLQEVLKEARYG
jgi:CheY-like chemotaxis protein